MSTLYNSQMDTTKPNFKRRLFCIEYPGRVNNVNNMIETLGGLDSIGTTYSSKNRRVEVRFRPKDIFCKPACGERYSTIGLLIKVKVKKKLRDPDVPCCSRDSEKLHSMTFTTSLVGVVDTIYKFDNLCDFQYLPMDRINPNSPDDLRLQGLHNRIFPPEIPDIKWLEENDVPYFLTPPAFSRFDTIHFYSGPKADPVPKKGKQLSKRKELPHTHTIGRTRKRRQNFGVFVNFSDNYIPQKPNPESLKILRIKFITEEQLQSVQKLFEERPLWSKNALLYRTPFNKDQLKHILPAIAFYYTTGPWRVMWCRYGYDPRKNPSNVIYQTFDYRLKQQSFTNKVKPKRSYTTYLLPYKSSPSSRPKVVIMNRHSMARAFNEAKNIDNKKKAPEENTCVFRPGMVPASRQTFYQYCDVLIPEIQSMLQDILNSLPPGTPCHKRLGFLPEGFDIKCREIVNDLVSAEMRRQTDQQPSESRSESLEIMDIDDDEDAEGSTKEYLEDDESPEEILDSDLEDDSVMN